MSIHQQYIQTLIKTGEKLSLEDFFKNIHQKFYSNYDISFMEYFLELTTQEGEFVVHHEKLIEYGIVTSNRSSTIKEKLDALELVEDEDYHLQDILQMVRPQGGGKRNNIYLLTPEAFKNCLLRARKYPKQKVDPKVYSRYYLLLEKIYKLYTDYEKKLLNKQLEQKDQIIDQNKEQLEQKDQELQHQAQKLEQKSQQLESQKHLVFRLNEMLIDSSSLPKTQVVYIATSSLYAGQKKYVIN